jgi:hypothetical protein
MPTVRPFPARTLEQALRVPEALRDKNGGRPWAPKEVAAALGIGATGGQFYYLAAASRDYGLTTGSRETAEIALTDLGRRAVSPSSADQQAVAYREAFLSVKVFRGVLDYYGGNNLPEEPFLGNTLEQEFTIPRKEQEEFAEIFVKNCRFLGIGTQYQATGGATAQVSAGGSVSVEGSVTVATPEKGNEAPVLFVIMPFTEREDTHETGFFDVTVQGLPIQRWYAASRRAVVGSVSRLMSSSAMV